MVKERTHKCNYFSTDYDTLQCLPLDEVNRMFRQAQNEKYTKM